MRIYNRVAHNVLDLSGFPPFKQRQELLFINTFGGSLTRIPAENTGRKVAATFREKSIIEYTNTPPQLSLKSGSYA